MAKEVLLYSPIFSFTAESVIQQLNDFQGEDVTLRINSPGGSVFAGWGMVASTVDFDGELTIKVDGTASSMAAILLLFHKNVEALNVSQFVLHRASTFSREAGDLDILAKVNKDIRAAFESKLDIPAFEKIAGITLDEFFTSEDVIDVNLNAKQAKKIGLISKINKLEPAEFEAMSMKFAAMSANSEPIDKPTKEASIEQNKPSKKEKMTFEELQAKHPELVAFAVAMGVTKERDRAGAWMAFNDVDPVAVAAGVAGTENLTQTAQADFSKKMFAAAALKETNEESAPAATTTEEDPTASPKKTELENFEASVAANLGLNAEKK